MTGADDKSDPKRAEQERKRAAGHKPGSAAQDRPGFDLGGASGEQPSGPTTGKTIPGGPKGRSAPGGDAVGRAAGRSDVSGSRSQGEGGEPGSASGTGSTEGSGERS